MAQRIITCGNCAAEVAVPEGYYHKKIRCYSCHSVLSRYSGSVIQTEVQEQQAPVHQPPAQQPAPHQPAPQQLAPHQPATHQARSMPGQQPYPGATPYRAQFGPQPFPGAAPQPAHYGPPGYPGAHPGPLAPYERRSGMGAGKIVALVVGVIVVAAGGLIVAVMAATGKIADAGEQLVSDYESWVTYVEPSQQRFTARFPGAPSITHDPGSESVLPGMNAERMFPADTYLWNTLSRAYEVTVVERQRGEYELVDEKQSIQYMARELKGTVETWNEATRSGTIRTQDRLHLVTVQFINRGPYRFILSEGRRISAPSHMEYFVSNFSAEDSHSLNIIPLAAQEEELPDPVSSPRRSQSRNRRPQAVQEGMVLTVPQDVYASARPGVVNATYPSVSGYLQWSYEADFPLEVIERSRRFSARMLITEPGNYTIRITVQQGDRRLATETRQISARLRPDNLLTWSVQATGVQPPEPRVQNREATVTLEFGRSVSVIMTGHWSPRADSFFTGTPESIDSSSTEIMDGVHLSRSASGRSWSIHGTPTSLGEHRVEMVPFYNSQFPYQEGAVTLTVRVVAFELQASSLRFVVGRRQLPQRIGFPAGETRHLRIRQNFSHLPEEFQPQVEVKINPDHIPKGLTISQIDTAPDALATIRISGTYEESGEFEIPVSFIIRYSSSPKPLIVDEVIVLHIQA
jgi:hypothetical protein